MLGPKKLTKLVRLVDALNVETQKQLKPDTGLSDGDVRRLIKSLQENLEVFKKVKLPKAVEAQARSNEATKPNERAYRLSEYARAHCPRRTSNEKNHLFQR